MTLSLSLSHLNTHIHTDTYYSHLSHWAVQTLNPAYMSPTHTHTHSWLNQHTSLTCFSHSPPNFLDFSIFNPPFAFNTHTHTHTCSTPPILSSSTSSLALLVHSGRMLPRTVRIVTASPYFQPVTPQCPVGCCPVGICCCGSWILRAILFSKSLTSHASPHGTPGNLVYHQVHWVWFQNLCSVQATSQSHGWYSSTRE